MDERLRAWRPTEEELERILEEMRPIIHEMARRDRESVGRLRRAGTGCLHPGCPGRRGPADIVPSSRYRP